MILVNDRVTQAVAELWSDASSIANEILAQRKRPNLIEWGEENYELPYDSAVQGKFRLRRLPYLRKPLECLHDDRVRQVVVAKGSQLAFTTCAQIWKGWTMDVSPASLISVWPTQGLLKRYVLLRINPMMEQCEPLKRIFSRGGLRDSDDSLNRKGFPGGSIDFITGGSTSQLKSITAKRMHVSELDELEADLKGQGDPLDQARRALRTHYNSKEYLECTPTIAGSSRVWRELELSSWNDYVVPCPSCNAMQVIRWREGQENGDSEGAGKYNFKYELDSANRIIPGSTRYVCIKCEHYIEHSWKVSMIDAGDWVPRFPDRVEYQGFHLSAFYALVGNYNWDYCAQLAVNGMRNPMTRKVFVNTICGLPYLDTGDVADSTGLQARAEIYRAEVPEGVVLLTCGVDVQGDRFEFLVIGWGAQEEAWVIEWGRVEGDPGKPATRRLLAEELNRDWTDIDGVCYGLAGIAIDAGYMGEMVKRFCRNFETKDGVRPIHVIGRDGRARPVISKPTADAKKRRRSKRPSWILGTDTVNDIIYARLRIEEPGPEYIHFTQDTDRLDPAFYKQLTAEELKTLRDRNGMPVRKYVLPPDRRNEGLDMTRLSYGSLHSLGGGVLTQLARMKPRAISDAEREHLRAARQATAAATAKGEEEEEKAPGRAGIPRRRPRKRGGVVSEAIS